jgi:hypothetical protein
VVELDGIVVFCKKPGCNNPVAKQGRICDRSDIEIAWCSNEFHVLRAKPGIPLYLIIHDAFI